MFRSCARFLSAHGKRILLTVLGSSFSRKTSTNGPCARMYVCMRACVCMCVYVSVYSEGNHLVESTVLLCSLRAAFPFCRPQNRCPPLFSSESFVVLLCARVCSFMCVCVCSFAQISSARPLFVLVGCFLTEGKSVILNVCA